MDNSSLSNNDSVLSEVVRFRRERPPADYLLKIESFSLLERSLKESNEDAFESSKFIVQGCTWVLRVHPNGNKNDDGEEYLSFSIKMVHVNAGDVIVTCAFKFFIYDHKHDSYLVLQDVHEKVFHPLKKESAISRAIKLTTFTDASRGFLINDCCIFGVEISDIKFGKIGASSLLQNKLISSPCSYTWKIYNFSYRMNNECVTSPRFMIGGFRWILHVYPKGTTRNQGKYLSFAIYRHHQLARGQEMLVEFELCLKDQLENDKDHKRTTSIRFDTSANVREFSDQFLPVKELCSSSSSNFIRNDSLIVEVTIKSMFMLSDWNPFSRKLEE